MGVRRLLAGFAFIASWPGAAPGQSVATSASVQVGPADSGRFPGYGLVVNTASGCLIVSAAHVLAGVQRAAWRRPLLGTEARPGTANVVRIYDQPDDDFLVLKPDVAIPTCAPYPTPSALTAALVPGAAVSVHSVRPDGSIQLLGGQLTNVGEATLGITMATPAARGISGAAVMAGGIPIGIVIGEDRASHLLSVRRFDRMAQIEGGKWLAPVKSPDAISSDLDEVELLWRGEGLEAMGRSASARATYLAAAQKGSVAAWMLYTEMLRDGDGGPIDTIRASSIEDRYFQLLIEQASKGDSAACLVLAMKLEEKTLTGQDKVRASAAIHIRIATLEARAAQDPTSLAWLNLLRVTELELPKVDLSQAYAKRWKISLPPEPLQLGGDPVCADIACRRRTALALLQSLLKAMEQGSEVTALLLGNAMPSLAVYAVFDPEVTLAPPLCAAFEPRDDAGPLRAAALASCTWIRRQLAWRKFDPVALDTDDDAKIWQAAIDSGYYGDDDSLIGLAGYSDAAYEQLRDARQRAASSEQNVDAMFGVILEQRWTSGPVELERSLRALLVRLPIAPDLELRSKVLGVLAQVQIAQLQNDDDPDTPQLRETLSLIERLNPALILEARDRIEEGRGVRYNPKVTKRSNRLLRVARSRGSALALWHDEFDFDESASLLRYGPLDEMSEDFALALQKDTDAAVQLPCAAEAVKHYSDAQHSRAIAYCEWLLESGVPAVSSALARIYRDDAKPADQRRVLEMGFKGGISNAGAALAHVMAKDASADFWKIKAMLERSAANGGIDAIECALSLMIAGKLPFRKDVLAEVTYWDDGYFEYLVRMALAQNRTFACYSEDSATKGCVVALSEGFARRGDVPAGSHMDVPEMSDAQFSKLEKILATAGKPLTFD